MKWIIRLMVIAVITVMLAVIALDVFISWAGDITWWYDRGR